jgi:DNA gyrase subunit A
VKYQPLTDYEAQRRGGRGKSATRIKEEDFVERLLVANTHDTILCFSTRGKVYWLKVYQLPEASRSARGRPIINLLPLEEGERITAILPVKEYSDDKYVFFATADGTVKKTSLSAFSRPLSSGIRAINLKEGDELIGVDITDGSNEIMLFSDAGKVVRFNEGSGRADADVENDSDADEDVEADAVSDDDSSDAAEGSETKGTFKGVRPMGRTAGGVRGIRLLNGDKVVSLIVPRGEGAILTATENGYGKRTALTEYPTKSRGTQGVRSIKVDERNGKVIDAIQVEDTDQIMLITNGGTLVRTRVAEVSIIGRNTGGVRLIRTGEDETVVGLQRIAESDEEEVLMDGESAEAGTAAAGDIVPESGEAQQSDQAEQADEE